jgi:hypothetical protein
LAGGHLQAGVSAKAIDSIGSALGAAATLPAGAAHTVSAAAKQAFIRGQDISSLVGLGVALAGAALAWRFLPAGMRVGAPAGSTTAPAFSVEPISLALAAEVDV